MAAALPEHTLETETITPDIPQPDLPHIQADQALRDQRVVQAVAQPTLTQAGLVEAFPDKDSQVVTLQVAHHTGVAAVAEQVVLAEQAAEIQQALAAQVLLTVLPECP
jgi:hypothetical protein